MSFIASHSMSAPCLVGGAEAFRPIRPKPLIPTRTAIPNLGFEVKE